MFVDVHKSVLYWMITAWDWLFNGWVVDYGTWPDQRHDYFSQKDVTRTLAKKYPNTGPEGAIHAGLRDLVTLQLARKFYNEIGDELIVGRCLVDANWGEMTDVVYQFCRNGSDYSDKIYPSHGKYFGASSVALSDLKGQQGDRIGTHWKIPADAGKRHKRHVLIDTNYWKSFAHSRLAAAVGDPACVTLFGENPRSHLLLSEHLTAEYRVKTIAKGRTVDEWKSRANEPDNHWLDCLVGCAVAASIEGVALSELKMEKKKPREKIKMSEFVKNVRNF